ncbi:polyisoprenoid-binding protein YceI [Pullulanibacillus pueri]|uniref:Polyisoprenoid-binding protein n=1 Tax=Pullulanibacillus pueri TaxID=1437324 RepID=A0A8J2ZT38_9BACL|nr:YceI family protein [Pullulanibacillus pueri]MBM7680324.1 polyisoprenoid-binding protein YceI [Pullulanibacillus pueri]GGH75655.1 polyisoprenoid-binding protein [Pullulanibacillus pueri]
MAKTKWVIDETHSSVDFSVKHMMVSKVKGTFHNFDATIEADPTDLTTADITFNIDLESIDTRNQDRDNHLKSADFFDVEKYPKITFKSTKIVKTSDDEYDVTGDVSLHGVTKPVTFAVTFEGQGQDPWGNQVAGFSATGKISRSDFGLTWNTTLETGGVLVGDDVKLSLEIEAKPE